MHDDKLHANYDDDRCKCIELVSYSITVVFESL